MVPLGPTSWAGRDLISVSDFRKFANATDFQGHDKITVVDGQEQSGSWINPGFTQNDDHPVVGISWEETQQFCSWLTQQDIKAGLITALQAYRLPTFIEWKQCLGNPKTTYPWGDQWPPPLALSANIAGCETAGKLDSIRPERRDEFEYTSPIGKFGLNEAGFSDMVGNVAQWCQNSNGLNRATCGTSWADSQAYPGPSPPEG